MPEKALSMVLFAACDSLGQTLGGVLAGMALALGGCSAIGLLMVLLCVLAARMPVMSARLPGAARTELATASTMT